MVGAEACGGCLGCGTERGLSRGCGAASRWCRCCRRRRVLCGWERDLGGASGRGGERSDAEDRGHTWRGPSLISAGTHAGGCFPLRHGLLQLMTMRRTWCLRRSFAGAPVQQGRRHPPVSSRPVPSCRQILFPRGHEAVVQPPDEVMRVTAVHLAR